MTNKNAKQGTYVMAGKTRSKGNCTKDKLDIQVIILITIFWILSIAFGRTVQNILVTTEDKKQ